MKDEVIAYTDPKSPVSEMFKTLRTNIQFMNSNKPLKTLLVTSTLPGEGKSWTAANLAVTFAQAGKKALIIDADMRKGRQFNIFDVPPTPGLSNYLSGIVDGESGEYEFQEFIKQTEVDNLSILPAGNVPPNPTELLVSEKMLDLIKKVDELYDITIFDGTPGLLVADASILSRIVDSSIIVTAHNETKIDNVSEVKKAIENIGGKVAGVVINKIPISSKKYENTYYYGHTTAPALIKEKKVKKLFNGFKDKKETIEDSTEELLAKQHELIEKRNKEQEKEESKQKVENIEIKEEEPKQEVESIEIKEEEPKQEVESIEIKEEEPKQEVESIEVSEVETKQETESIIKPQKEFVLEEVKIENIEIPNTFQINQPIESSPFKFIDNNFNTEIKQNNVEQSLFEQNNFEEKADIIDNVESNFEECTGPKLSWEQEAESAYERIKKQNAEKEPIINEEPKFVNTDTVSSDFSLNKTQKILDQINQYLDEERKKFRNGGLND